jgi:hypothetical protein
VICPDCKQPVETHAMYRSGRCPVVRIPHYFPDGPPQAGSPLPIRITYRIRLVDDTSTDG